MEKGKRKYLVEPVQQEGISKYGRKVSKFVFKLTSKSFPSSLTENSIKLNTNQQVFVTEDKQISNQSDCRPSIILCKSNTSLDDLVYEKEFTLNSIKLHSPKKADIKLKTNFSPKYRKRKIEKVFNQNQDRSNLFNEKVDSEIISLTPIKIEGEYSSVLNGGKDDRKKMKSREIENKLFNEIKTTKDTKLKNICNFSSNLSDVIVDKPKINTTYRRKTQQSTHLKQDSLTNIKIQESECKYDKISKKSSLEGSNLTSPHRQKLLTNKIEEDIEKLVQEKIRVEDVRLTTESEKLLKKLNDLKEKAEKVSLLQSYQKERLTLNKLKQNQEMLYYYIGFKDMTLIDVMIDRLTEYFSDIEEKVCLEVLIEDQLTMTLMKLRRNYSMHDLSFRFRVSLSDAYCIVYNIILGLHHLYYENESHLKPFPTVSSMQNNLPDQFLNFPNCRVVLECVRIGCEDPDNELDSDIFTSVKFDPKVYLKGLIAISPTKQVLYASNLYECAIDNSDIFRDCGILNKFDSGDLIMADKSFDSIYDMLPSTIDLNIPTSINTTLSDKQLKNLNSKARALIGRTTMQHVRRFSILNHIPIFLNPIAVKVFQLCSVLVNLQPTINIQSESNIME